MKKRVVPFVIILFLVFGIFANARSANPIDLGFQTASIWDSILSWFSSSGTNSVNNKQEQDIVNPEDLNFNSTNFNYDAQKDSSSQNTPSFNFGSDNLSCLPNIKRQDQNILISYSCPSGFDLSESNFEASGNYGIIKTNTDKNSLYIKCKGEDTEKIFTCKVQNFNSVIETFKITPANPKAGELFQFSLKTKGMQNCVVFNKNRSFKKEGTEMQFSSKAFENDTIYLNCVDKSGLTRKAQINY